MVTKRSKEIVDNLLESVYYENHVTVGSYEQSIVEIMVELDCTISEALDVDFGIHKINTGSTIDVVDYLESRLNQDLYKVNMLMQIYTHQIPDFKLKPLV
jgi:hypothetical protein